MKLFNISPINNELKTQIKHKIDFKTKPLNSLGTLEKIAEKLCLIQETLTPQLNNTALIVFAADHGIAATNIVSPYPQEVTAQMVLNFLSGGAAINVFCEQNNINLSIVDAGVNFEFTPNKSLINAKIAHGTCDYSKEPAMSEEQCYKAIEIGSELMIQKHSNGCNCISFGEMGIGNTSSAALLMSAFTKIPIENCVGKGTGLTETGVSKKATVLKQVQEFHGISTNALENLQNFGGFEIAMICGAMLEAAELKMTIIVDGFIVTSALLVAQAIEPTILDYCLFSHVSDEQGHKNMLNYLNATPILQLDLRLGEGTGAAIVYPIIQSAANFMNKMASFESAGVSNKEN
ncbi:nicotinate-nucleotide--dimethylbenzimidazole phosphoribosyltransferase [Lutibacter sp.]|uniref:nicotinate-nucleotide--dimethylbenzimidazole phosphoribosyltransferase n=1 Tax=Lutibacter sp. TaxID=1925666 RepID=UPI0035642C27